jgi:Rrf2 family protein
MDAAGISGGDRVRSLRHDLPIRVSAKADYAIRATAELAAAEGQGLVKGEQIAAAQRIPLKFLLNILTELRHARIVRSQRGSEGGYQLALPASKITLADVIIAVEGVLSTVQDSRPEELHYLGAAEPLGDVWRAVHATLESVLTSVTLADLAAGHLPKSVSALLTTPTV